MATGEYLKQQRTLKKLSLSDVAKAIKLDEYVLSDIENDQASHIALIYRNGYIQAYARFLGVTEEEIQALTTPDGVQEPAIKNIFAEPLNRNPLDKWLRATSYVVASLLIGTLAWQFTHEAVRLSQNGSQLQQGEETISGTSGVSVNSQQTQQLRGPVNASIAPLGALHDGNPDALDTAERAWAAISRPALPEGESRLHISVSADSWVEITDANGQELEMDLLRGGSNKDYHGKPPFRILFGRASAVKLSVDGEAVDLSAFTNEDVAQLSWPQKLRADSNGQSGY